MITYEDKFKELLKELNKKDIEQTSSWEDCIPEEIYKKYFDKYTLVTTGLIMILIDGMKHQLL